MADAQPAVASKRPELEAATTRLDRTIDSLSSVVSELEIKLTILMPEIRSVPPVDAPKQTEQYSAVVKDLHLKDDRIRVTIDRIQYLLNNLEV